MYNLLCTHTLTDMQNCSDTSGLNKSASDPLENVEQALVYMHMCLSMIAWDTCTSSAKEAPNKHQHTDSVVIHS